MNNKILILSLLTCFNLFSQESADSDENFNFKKYNAPKIEANIFNFYNYTNLGGVNHLTGNFGLNIPFQEIKTPFYNLPIILSYSTSGVKMNDISNEIGLDWNLSAGGSISRIVNGEPDDVFESIGTFIKSTSDIQPYDLMPNEYKLQNVYPAYRPIFNWSGHFGSATNSLGTHYQIKFPIRYDQLESQITNPINSEIGCLLEMKYYREWSTDSYTGPIKFDTEPDIFNFNVGTKNFSFILKRKAQNYNDLMGVYPIDNYVEAVPLNELGYKIKIIEGGGVFFKHYKNQPRINFTRFIEGFEVTDKDGIKYIFNKYDYLDFDVLKQYDNQWQDSNVILPGKRVVDYKEYMTQINKWHLTKIELPNSEEISLSYINNEYLYQKDVIRTHDGVYKGYTYNLNPKYTFYGIDWLDIHTEGYSISEIKYNNQKISFSYDSYRPDYKTGGLNLKKIELFYDNTLIKKVDLIKKFDFFEDDGHRYYRMYLKELIDSQLQNSHVFEYFNPELNKRADVRYQDLFGYYIGNSINTYPSFPTIYISPDKTNGDKISYDIPTGSNYFTINGTNRNPNPLYTKSGAMNTISFPTGGKLEINYENNTYYDNRLITKKSLGPGVRVKTLKYYTEDDELATQKEYNYDSFYDNSFSSGKLLYRPSYAFISNWSLNNDFNRYVYESSPLLDESNPSDKINYWSRVDFTEFYSFEMLSLNQSLSLEDIYKKMIHFSSYPMGATSDFKGRELMYENVSESVSGISTTIKNGTTKFYFKYSDNRVLVNSITGPSDEQFDFVQGNTLSTYEDGLFYPFYPLDLYSSPDDSNRLKTKSGLIEKKGYEIYPFPQRNYFKDIENAISGELLKIEKYDTADELVYSEENEYDFIMKESSNVNVLQNINTGYLKMHQFLITDPQEKFYPTYSGLPVFNFYELNRQNFNGLYLFSIDSLRFNNKVVLKKKTIKNYFNSGSTNVKQEFSYQYDNYTGNLIKTVKSGSNLDIIETRYDYPYADSGDYFLDSLANRNIISKPYYKEIKVNNVLSENTEFKYYIHSSGMVLPSKLKKYKVYSNSTGIGEDVFLFKDYNEKGQLQEYSEPNGLNTVLIYGYNKSEIVAKIENKVYSSIPSSLIQSIETASDNNDEVALLNALNALRNDSTMLDAMITTYTYKPLVGVSTITDPKGNKVSYFYDGFGRLKSVTDKDGNILSENEYHYRTE